MWRDGFPPEGSYLERYAARFRGVEINSSFYRQHKRAVYARWAAAVPADFRFAVKAPRAITHEQSLVASDVLLDVFLEEVGGLGQRLGPLLVQLPPSLPFDAEIAEEFFVTLRELYAGPVACEPRHPTWFDNEAEALLRRFRVARVAADPARVPPAATPGGWHQLVYYRLHGTPVMYRSVYSSAYLMMVAAALRAQVAAGVDCWCVFDNTTLGGATGNALTLAQMSTS